MEDLYHNPCTIYRIDKDYHYANESKVALSNRLYKSNRTAIKIINALKEAGFKYAYECTETWVSMGVYAKSPSFRIPYDKKEAYFVILDSIDRTNISRFY